MIFSKAHPQKIFEYIREVRSYLWENEIREGKTVFVAAQEKIRKLHTTSQPSTEIACEFLGGNNILLIPYDACPSTSEIWWVSGDEFAWDEDRMVWTFISPDDHYEFIIYSA